MFGVLRQSSIAPGAIRATLEFIIIVAGVLVALMAEEWRQSLADSVLEAEYLERLAVDVQEDIRTYGYLEQRLDDKNAALTNVQSWIETPDRSEQALKQLMDDLSAGARLGYGAGTAVQQVTFDELVSTGRLQFVRDTALRTALISYYEAVAGQRVRVLARQTGYPSRIYELIPNESEFVPRRNLTLDQLLIIANKVSEADVGEFATAELNRGLVRKDIVLGLASLAESLLAQIKSQLGDLE